MKNSMTKRIISLFLLLIFMLSACSPGQNSAPAHTSASETSSETPAPQTEVESAASEGAAIGRPSGY